MKKETPRPEKKQRPYHTLIKTLRTPDFKKQCTQVFVLFAMVTSLVFATACIAQASRNTFFLAKFLTAPTPPPEPITIEQPTPKPAPKPSAVLQVAELLTHGARELRNNNGRTNIILLGTGDEGHDGEKLTDTIILISLHTETKRVGMVSIPRDLFVEVPELGYSTKINSVIKQTETDLSPEEAPKVFRGTIERVTDMPVHYTMHIDFAGFEQLVDSLGGIDITLEEGIDDPFYPGPQYSYDPFTIEKGDHTLDGKTALKVARSRYTTPGGDFGRARRQHAILKSMSAKTSELLKQLKLKELTTSVNIVEEFISTDLTLAEMKTVYTAIQAADPEQIQSIVLSSEPPDPLLKNEKKYLRGKAAFALVPTKGEDAYEDIHATVAELLQEYDHTVSPEKEGSKTTLEPLPPHPIP